MHRFFLPPEQCETQPVFLTGREAHHGLHVLRIKRGELISVLDGAGRELFCEVRAHDRDKISLHVLEKKVETTPGTAITLLQAIPKGKLIESIIQKATELGVSRIVPLLTERVVVHLDGREAVSKAAKWQIVAIEAIKQCGAKWLPKIEPPMTPQQFLQRSEKVEMSLVGSLQGDGKHPREYFQAFQAKHQRVPHSAAVWIGPEGDFTPRELDAIRDRGALPITLGSRVLRTETAAIYCLSFLNYELQAAH